MSLAPNKRIRQLTTMENNLTTASSFKVSRRDQFAIFVKILLNNLKKSGDIELLSNAKRAILLCTRRNSAGDPNFMPLADVTSTILFSVVGETHWRRAHLLVQIAQKRAERKRMQQQQYTALQAVFNEANLRQKTLTLNTEVAPQSLLPLLMTSPHL